MKRLDDISKKPIFEVPERYFDALPLKIQARVAQENEQARPIGFFFQYKLQYALPVVLIVLATVLWLQPEESSVEGMLANVETEELIVYLQDSEISTEDLLDELSAEDIDEIEAEVYSLPISEEALEEALIDLDI